MITGISFALIVIDNGAELTVFVLKQLALFVILTDIEFPATRLFVEYVADVSPVISIPLFCHWYVGAVPPLVGVAVNVTFVPSHIEVCDAAMVTDGVTLDTKLTATGFEVAEVVLKQDALLVMITVIEFPATRLFVV